MGAPSWPLLLGDLGRAATLLPETRAELLASREEPADGEPYGRRSLHRDAAGEVMLAGWRAGAECAPHDHAAGEGLVLVLAGTFTETDWTWRDGLLGRGQTSHWKAGDAIPVARGGIHSMVAHEAGTTLHLYRPAISGMRVFDPVRRVTLAVHDDCGAWVPRDEAMVMARLPWRDDR